MCNLYLPFCLWSQSGMWHSSFNIISNDRFKAADGNQTIIWASSSTNTTVVLIKYCWIWLQFLKFNWHTIHNMNQVKMLHYKFVSIHKKITFIWHWLYGYHRSLWTENLKSCGLLASRWPPCIMCSVHRGMSITSGRYHEYIGEIFWVHRGYLGHREGGGLSWFMWGIMSTLEGAQYNRGISWAHRKTFSTLRDIMSISGDVQHIGGYGGYTGGCSVHGRGGIYDSCGRADW